MKKQTIIFTQTMPIVMEKPKPATAYIPEWYKNYSSYITGEKKPQMAGVGPTTPATVKRCMPVFDAMTAGYIIETPADIFVSQVDGKPYYQWAALDLISFHPVNQASTHPSANGLDYPKFTNPWSIKTPKGYSTLFVQPMHRESPFTILPGVVDTDTYTAAVNFPFVLNDTTFEGMIPKGTPMAQVIPFKRDEWNSQLGTQVDYENQLNIARNLATMFFDKYRNFYRSKKTFN